MKSYLNHRIFMLYKSVETCHPVSLPYKGTNILIFVTCRANFYLWVWSVQPPIQSLYPWVRCIYMQECSMHFLIHLHDDLLFPWVQVATNLYMQERFCTRWSTTSIQMLVHVLFPWVQCQSLKPVLSQCSQTSFVTVDDLTMFYDV